MGETPSARRRKGRNAYYRGGYPNELNPYKDAVHACDWREGWDQAKSEDDARAAEEQYRDDLRALHISYAIDVANVGEDVKEILRRIAEHVGMP